LIYICGCKYSKFLRGQTVPSFYIKNLKNLQEIIERLADDNLAEKEHFIVGVKVSAEKGPSKISILLDGDNGVTIDDCVHLSRSVGHILEEEEIIEAKYTLEVTSPGVDYPLSSLRQYQKNVGRSLKISLNEGKEIKGILKEVSEEKLLIDKEVKKGKKINHEPVEVAFDEINKTIVQVSFK